MMQKLVLVRHGQSIWNLENKFTGWTDVGLSDKGVKEAIDAGKTLKKLGYTFDVAYTSLLKRAQDTLNIILKELDLNIEINKTYKLNERHYGALQGLNKDQTRKKYGEEQVRLWRRSAEVRPPALTKDDPRYPGNDPIYKDIPESELPLTENLVDTIKRVVSYYESTIIPDLILGKKIIIVAHGNSLRGLVKYLDNLSDEEVMDREIPTGVPLVYELDNNLKPIKESSKEKKQKIIDIGFKLMCEKGYHNVSCVDIAASANVSTGIIYQYFKDKLDIFIAGTKLYSEKLMFPMLNALENKNITKENFDKILRNMVDDAIKAHTLTKNAHKELMSMSCLDNEVFAIFNCNEEDATEKLVRNFPKVKNIKEKVHLLINMVDNLCHEIVYHHHDGYDYEFMKEETIKLIEYMMEDTHEN